MAATQIAAESSKTSSPGRLGAQLPRRQRISATATTITSRPPAPPSREQLFEGAQHSCFAVQARDARICTTSHAPTVTGWKIPATDSCRRGHASLLNNGGIPLLRPGPVQRSAPFGQHLDQAADTHSGRSNGRMLESLGMPVIACSRKTTSSRRRAARYYPSRGTWSSCWHHPEMVCYPRFIGQS